MNARAPLVALTLAAVACVRRPIPPPPVAAVSGPIRVAVLPFRVAAAGGEDAIPPDAGATAARLLAAQLETVGLTVVDPTRVASAVAEAGAGAPDARLASRIARDTGATVAILGVLSRYRERRGPAWAAESPASIAYETGMVRASDGAVVAVDRFEHTQQALSENLLELPSFVHGSARWRTRAELLDEALARTARRLAAAVAVGRPPAPG